MDVDSVVFARALADDTRQRIMTMLCCDTMCVGDIVVRLDELGERVTQPTVSHHLSILKDAGLVHWRREGKQVFYKLNQRQVSNCCAVVLVSFAPESEMAADLVGDDIGET